MEAILILDGNQRSALAATRSLGNKGLKVITGDEFLNTIAGASSYATEEIVYPSPSTKENEVLEFRLNYLTRQEINIILPMTDLTTGILSNNKSMFPDILLPIPDFHAYDSLSNKANLCDIASKHDIPVPKTKLISNLDSVSSAVKDFKYPIVVKPSRSISKIGGLYLKSTVSYLRKDEDIENLKNIYPNISDNPLLLQEYIEGYGKGMFFHM